MKRIPLLSGYLSVRWKLIVPYLLIAGLVFAVLLPVTTRIVSERIEDEADRRLVQTANAVAVLIEQSEQQALLSANFVASLPEMIDAGDDTEIIGDVIDRRRLELGLQELSFYGTDFQAGDPATVYSGPVITAFGQSSQEATRVRNGVIIKTLEAIQSHSALAITPQASQIIGTSPILSPNGNLLGVIVAVYYVDDTYMDDIGEVVNSEVAVVSRNAVIASTFDNRTPYEQLIRDNFLDNVEEMPSRNIDFDGSTQQRIVASPLVVDGERRGVVMVAQPIESLEVIQDDIQSTILMLSLVVVAASLIFGVFSFFNFARPLTRLTEATNEVSSGNLNKQVQISVPKIFMRDELTTLSENFNDMTYRLRDLYEGLERKVEERTQELNDTMKELAIARDEALEANRTKSAFMANMSHELRTPLNAIIGYSNLLIAGTYGTTNEKQDDRLQRILDNGQHLLALINDVLDLSKIEAGKMELYLEDFSLSELLDNVVQTSSALMDKNRNVLKRSYAQDSGIMHSDVTKVRQVLFNLISNAAKFTNEGTVTVSAADETRHGIMGMRFDVIDTGIGMTPEQQSKVFREFVQADTSTTRKYGGTGLGLTISKRFCEMLGGSIDLTSEPGVGTTFTVWLPRVSQPLKSDTGEYKKIETGTHEQVDKDRTVVLVIDDDEASLETLQHYLEGDGFHVMTTNSGADGLRIAQEHQPHVIMLDVLMPGMDGWAVLSKLKQDPQTSHIPVIMTTIVSDRNLGFALGATDYVSKPVNRNQVLTIVNKYRCMTDPCPVLIVEDDDAARQMMRDMLEAQGWQVNEAVNGAEGLEALKKERPQIILLDLMMPQMNGFEFLRRLRTNEQWSSIPVVVITAMDLTPQHHEELMTSVQQIIQKGEYQPEDLIREVRYWAQATLET